jgi:hypothetical protein
MLKLPDYACTNFDTLARAFADGRAALVACSDRATGELVPTICAVEFDGETYTLKPFGTLFTDNPYDRLDPP